MQNTVSVSSNSGTIEATATSGVAMNAFGATTVNNSGPWRNPELGDAWCCDQGPSVLPRWDEERQLSLAGALSARLEPSTVDRQLQLKHDRGYRVTQPGTHAIAGSQVQVSNGSNGMMTNFLNGRAMQSDIDLSLTNAGTVTATGSGGIPVAADNVATVSDCPRRSGTVRALLQQQSMSPETPVPLLH